MKTQGRWEVAKERPERLLAVEGREEVRAGVGAEGLAGTWTGCSAWPQAFRQGSNKTRTLLCSRRLLRSGQMS